ncbi:hypothetical protein IMZ31_23440 (plasmid) [Pontibacillus sp. ALD_SL1]|uniref:hypothetical protein n=1 Tax=Pontibacillus sp. ALD_SL1 TaxID=2777185 RepID=UPI001A974D12|nr:hypothetical protein [Pontibacillus sp. ALD_SL1]QST02407.1 hypothetical protein IMZ31_23440 [Pontibacillus sp. ALD_SL1]
MKENHALKKKIRHMKWKIYFYEHNWSFLVALSVVVGIYKCVESQTAFGLLMLTPLIVMRKTILQEMKKSGTLREEVKALQKQLHKNQKEQCSQNAE